MLKNSAFLILFWCFVTLTNAMTPITISSPTVSVLSYTDSEVILQGKTDLHITSTYCKTALAGSIVRLIQPNSWLFFDNIRPSVAIDSLLQYVYIGQDAAVLGTNIRVSIYKHGVVFIPHSADIKPLTVYTEKNFSGDSTSYSLNTYYNNLGNFNNKIRSIKLRRGYMATLAANADGTGYSRVFIADTDDQLIPELSIYLDKVSSFIRVFEWDYVTKKGWAGGDSSDTEKIKGTWWYSWSASWESTKNQQYVPIRQTSVWPGWDQINGKQHVSHLLGFNEPDRPDQANMSVQNALLMWPDFMKSGLRVGTPSPSDPSNPWISSFLDSCKIKNYRVDYLVIHCYWGGKSAQQWYNDLKSVHQRTGLPIWITEWNNGANWTNETWPDASKALTTANAAKQLNDIKGILNVLDTASFIERYSIYNWVQDCRAMILNGALTPAGEYYMNDKSNYAFNRKKEVIPSYSFKRNTKLNISYIENKINIAIIDPEPDYFRGFVLEKKIGEGSYFVLLNSSDELLKATTDTIDMSKGTVKYRAKTKLADGSFSNYSPEFMIDATLGNETVQFGSIDVTNVDWNPVFFSKPFSVNPSIILGSPTNNNTGVKMAPRVRLVAKESRFTVSCSPWQYQNTTSLTKEENIPYLILAPGSYDFGGGVKAIAGSANSIANWASVTFPTPFDSVPVVFANQLNSPTTYATAIRIKDVTTTGFKIRITKEKAVTATPGLEKVSYIAITPGKGNISGQKVVVGRTAPNYITTSSKTITYGDTIANPLFIAQMQTCNDDTTAVLRSYLVRDYAALVFKQRETSKSSASTASESVGWLIFDQVQSALQGLKNPVYKKLGYYPNPVKDKLYFTDNLKSEEVKVYNLSGQLLKNAILHTNYLDVSDLKPGFYFLLTTKRGAASFVKN